MKRGGKDGPTVAELTAAIRAKCRDCCGGSVKEITRCTMKAECALWPYRPNAQALEQEQPLEGQTSMFDT